MDLPLNLKSHYAFFHPKSQSQFKAPNLHEQKVGAQLNFWTALVTG